VIERQVFEHPPTGSLASILESAVQFGLTEDEVWETFVETSDLLPEEIRQSYLDELSGGLAKRLVAKERGA
jgi:hypothetical protein